MMTVNPHRVSGALPSSQRGVMLLEALVAIVIFSIGLLGLLALQARSISLEQDAKYRAQAAMLANELIGLVLTQEASTACTTYGASSTAYANWLAHVQASLPAATVSGVDNTGAAVAGLHPVTCTADAATGQLFVTIDVSVSWKLPSAKERHAYRISA